MVVQYYISVTFYILGVKVCGIFLHNVSGKVNSVVRSPYGRQVMALLIANFSDLQLHIGNWFYFMR